MLAALGISLLALYPQLNLWSARGRDWNGAYAYMDTDEVAYSAYVNALIDGRPRRNDPYTGRDDRASAPQPESLFSIQFLPAYMIALPARAFGLSTSTVFILLLVVAAFAASLTIFRLVWEVSGHEIVAMVTIPFALCLGTLVSGRGEIVYLFGYEPAYDGLPFVRRYLPAVVLPFFFLFCIFLWRVITRKERRAGRFAALAAGLTFALLVFSYFYVWTAAVALLGGLALLLLIARPEGWRQTLLNFGLIGLCAVAALIPYSILLSHRSPTMDKAQVLTLSHAPDFLRGPELIGLAALVALGIGARRGLCKWKSGTALFTAALALMPAIVFNQQIITGRSLQPIHYEQFIGNYVALVALALTVSLLWQKRAEGQTGHKIRGLVMVCVALASFGWGVLEVRAPREIYLEHNTLRDEAVPVIMRLKELARNVPDQSDTYPIVLSNDDMLSESLPTYAPLGVLWTRHMHVFSGVTLEENKERFYQQLYYEGIDAQEFSERAHNDFQVLLALFGWERANSNLTVHQKPVTEEEINAEVNNYSAYIASFNRDRAAHPVLSYVVINADGDYDFNTLDRWYERDAGERIGKYMLFRLKLKPEEIRKEKEKRKKGA